MIKNPFVEFDAEGSVGHLEEEVSSQGMAKGLLATARNPFVEFVDENTSADRAMPMDEILATHASAMETLTDAFKKLVEACVGDKVWREDRASIEKTYETACRIAQELSWRAEDIEAFGVHALRSDDSDFFLMGPLGLFFSAFCNASSEANLKLDLSGQDLRVPLVGYRLREGVSLVVAGNLGDLVGISVAGGHLTVNGSVGRYLGAGMSGGRIAVTGDAGRFVGEQMTGGEIHVEGRLGGVGKPEGGKVFHRAQVIFE